jgi:Mg/Co/Ni transporter MgtE
MDSIDPISADFADRFPDSFARVAARGSDADVTSILESLPPATKASIAARLPGARIDALLRSGRHDARRWLEDASFEDAVGLLSRIPRERRLALVNSLKDHERRRQLLRHEQYPTHSVGALVGDIPLRFSAEARASDAVFELRANADAEPGPLVVVDQQGRYMGTLNTWRLLARKRAAGNVAEYTNRVAAIHPETSILSAVENPDWDRNLWLPVIDHRRRVLGAVSRAALFKAARRQTGDAGAGTGGMIGDLLRELVYAMGELLEWIFARKST